MVPQSKLRQFAARLNLKTDLLSSCSCYGFSYARGSLCKANVALFVLSIVIGWILYHGQMGSGDALILFSPNYASAPLQEVWTWYTTINGRLSQALTAIIFWPFSYFSNSPENFPYWIPRSLMLFCMLTIPLNLIFILCRTAACGFREFWFLFCLLFMVWSVNPVIYNNSIWFEFNFGAYYLPIYLITLACWIMLHIDWSKATKISYWLIHSLIYVFISLYGEQYIPTVPILFLTMALVAGSKKEKALSFYWKLIALYSFLTVIASLIYTMAPGQQLRNPYLSLKKLDLSFDGIVRWYIQAVPSGYATLFTPRGYPGLLTNAQLKIIHFSHSVMMFLVIIIMIMFGLVYVKARNREIDHMLNLNPALKTGILALGFIFAYFASVVTLMVSPYFPDRAGIYPSLLLVASFATTLLLISQTFESQVQASVRRVFSGSMRAKQWFGKQGPNLSFVSFAILLLGFVLITVTYPNFRRIIQGYSEVKLLSRVRVATYHVFTQKLT